MGTSRIQKFKEYRNSLIKEDSPVLDETNNDDLVVKTSSSETTSTLPLNEVIGAMEEENNEAEFVRRAKRKRIIQYCLIGLGGALLVAGIIVFAVLVFR